MMRQLLFILTITFLIFGCENNAPDTTSNNDTVLVESNNKTEPFTYNVYKFDSVTIELKTDHKANFFVALSIGNSKREYDLTKLNIPTKTPDEIQWANNDFACMMTWFSGAQSRHIFLPTNNMNELIYLDKDVEETDSINNNIVYVDSIYEITNKVVFKAENLLTRKSKTLEFSINEKNGIYPFYDDIVLTKNNLTIKTATETKSVDITEINNGL